jgi:predicted ATPase with chaperone activity
MALGNLLVREHLVTQEQVNEAIARQKIAGGLLGDNLVALGYVDRSILEAFLQAPPSIPKSIDETGLNSQFLISLVVKLIYLSGLQTVPEIADQVKLSRSIVETLLQMAKKEGLVEIRGAVNTNLNLLRHNLTNSGKERAAEALKQSLYVGPAPVPLPYYLSQVRKQSTHNERITAETLRWSFSHLVLSPEIPRRLGPAVNAGKSILIYGPSGNGKTCVSEAIGETFKQPIYIPYCIEVDGQIIKIFDSAVHREAPEEPKPQDHDASPIHLRQAEHDFRWARCRRPLIITGGELTLEMLDLDFDPISKYYEAPLQMKAVGGIFVIDDFGRQLVRPHDLLNRWIIPLEKKVDYLTLHTGKKFEIPFDELVIFSTNLSPEELSDPAFLRRIQYKIRVDPPTIEDYKEIFRRICDLYKLELPEEVVSFIVDSFYPSTQTPVAAYHPKFIVEHAIAACSFENVPPRLTLDLVKDAVENLLIKDYDLGSMAIRRPSDDETRPAAQSPSRTSVI